MTMAMPLGSPLSYSAFKADIDDKEEDACSRGRGCKCNNVKYIANEKQHSAIDEYKAREK